jgi:GGDEF domain-containing protein
LTDFEAAFNEAPDADFLQAFEEAPLAAPTVGPTPTTPAPEDVRSSLELQAGQGALAAEKPKPPDEWPYLYVPKGDEMGQVSVVADFISPSGTYVWTAQPERTDYVTTDAYREKRAAENEVIRAALLAAAKQQADKLTAYQVAEALGMKVSEAQQNLEAFRAVAVATQADPEEFRKKAPPELVRLVLRNPTMATNLVERKPEEENTLVALIRMLAGVTWELMFEPEKAVAVMDAEGAVFTETQYKKILAGGPLDDVPEHMRSVTPEEARAWLEKNKERLQRAHALLEASAKESARPRRQVDDASAQAIREEGAGVGPVVAQRYKESSAGIEAARLRYQRMMADLGGASQDELLDYDIRIHDLELEALPRYLAEGEWTQLAGEATQGVASTLAMVPEMGATAFAGMSVGALAGAIIAQRTGMPVAAGARSGAMAMAGPSALLGAAEASFYVEVGSSQKELHEMLTDKGQHLTKAEEYGGALVAGALKAGLEVLQLNALAKTFGSKRGLLAVNPRKAVADLLAKDPRFRALVARAASQWAKSSLEEGFEEGLQTAVDQAVSYLVQSIHDEALQTRNVFDVGDIAEDAVAGALGGMALGTPGTVTQVVSGALQTGQSARVETRVKQVLQLAQHDVAQRAPAEVAQAAKEASAKAGLPITALHVDGKAAQRYFQERAGSDEEARAQADAALGPGGAEKVAEAAATGGFVEIPLEDVLARWGQTDAAKALAADTTTHPSLLTPRQIAEGGLERIEAEARRIAEEALKAEAEEQKTRDQLDAFEQQVIDVYVEHGRKSGEDEAATREKARAAARMAKGLVRAFMETQAKDFQQAVGELFTSVPVAVLAGDEAPVATTPTEAEARQPADSVQALLADAERVASMPEGMARAAYQDALTGLLNRQGFDLVQKPDSPSVVVALTTPDVKAINDTLGHEQANRLFRAIGALVREQDPNAARQGTNFLFRADSLEQAKELAARWMQQFPEGLQLVVGVGTTSEDALANLEDRITAGRAKSKPTESLTEDERALLEAYPDAPQLPAVRGETRLKLDELTSETSFGAAQAPAESQLPAEVLAAAAARFRSPADFVAQEYCDQQTGGQILNARGFAAVGPRRFTMTLDGIGLKALNDRYTKLAREKLGMSRRDARAFGRAVGDRMLKHIAQAAADLGGMGVNFARLSGDEFAAKADNLDELLQFVADLKAELAASARTYKLPDGTDVQIPADVRWGAAEGNYEHADRDLARRKAEDANADSGLPWGGTPADRAERAARRGVSAPLWSRPQAESRGSPAPAGSREGEVGPGQRVEDAKARLFQEVSTLTQDDNKSEAPKGYVLAEDAQATARVVRVFLNRNADVSTILHETAHAFLFLLEKLAQRPDAPSRTKETYQAAIKWLGGESFAGLSREQHEKWARSFEAYVMEGRAPSATLAKVFAEAKRWLERIYRAIRGIPGQQLDDDVRRVFDAMLATQAEVDAMLRRRGPPLFRSATEAGVSEAQWQAQLEAQREAYAEASRKVQLQAVKDALRVHEKWWKDGLAKLRKQFEEEYENLPGRRVQRILEEGNLVLDRAAVEAVIGKVRVKGLRTAVEGGVHPARVAEAAGIESPAVALAALAGLKPKARWVEEQAQAEMERLHPGILDDIKRMRAEVADALQDVAEKRILDELAALRRKDPSLGEAPVEALRRAARLLVEQRELRHVSPARALQQERSAAERAVRAAAKGEWAKVVEAKREQLLNAYLYRELRQAEKDLERLEKLAQRLSRTPARARLGKAAPSYRDAVDFLIDVFLRGNPPGNADVLRQAVADLNRHAVIVGDPEWLEPVVGALGTPWEKLTVKQAGAVLDALKMLQAAAAQRNTALVEGRRVEKEALVAQMVDEARQHKKALPLPATRSTQTAVEKVRDFLSGWDAFLRNPIDLVRELVGDNQESAWWKAMVDTMRRAKYREAELLKQAVEPIIKAFEAIPKSVRESLNDAIDGARLFPTHANFAPPRRRFELLMMALNAGNTSNLQRLLDGRNITFEQLRAALDLLTREEIDWVQSVFDAAESLRPEAFALEERLTGLRPKAIEPTPLQLKNGTLRGGYFPAVYEARASQVGQRQEARALADIFDPSYTRPSTPHSHLKSRADKVEAVISLEPGNIYAHLAQVAHDIAFREALLSVGGLLLDPRIDAVLKERLGYEKAKSFLQWAKDIGSAQSPANNAVVRAVRFVRSRMAPALLGWRLPTALGDLANLPAAIPSTKLTTASLMRGIIGFLKSPLAARQEALAKSPELRFMARSARQQYQSVTDTFVARGNPALRWYKEHAFAFMEAINAVTATPIWMGAYSQALRAGMTEDAAVRWADDILTQVFPSHSVVEQAGVLRDKGFAGLSTVFYGYLSVAYRAQARIFSEVTSLDFAEAGLAEKAKTVASVSGRLLAFWLSYQVLGELLMGRGPEDGDRDDEEPEDELLKWRNWMLRKLLSAPLQTIPFVGDAVPAIEAALLGRRPRAREGVLSSYITSIGAGVLKALDGEKDPLERADAAWRVVSTALGLPAYPVSTPLKYWLRVGSGDIEPASAADAILGTVYGPPRGP